MAAPSRHPVLRLTPASVIRAVALLGLTLGVLALIASSTRVIGWIVVAAVLAGLLHPAVMALSTRMPRALALLGVLVLCVGSAAGIAYAVVDEVAGQLHELQVAVPRAAREIERSDRFGEAAREIDLAERAGDFVDAIPERLRGGDVQSALRSAATRGVAFLATTVLTIFFLIHGPRLLAAALRQLPEARQPEVRRVALATYRRAWHYITGTLGLSAVSALITYACAAAIDAPGKAPLALWMALLDPIPLLGVVLGAVPLVLLAATTASGLAAVLVTVVLLGWQIVEGVYLQRRVEEHSLHIGPFVTIAVAAVGLELYGIGGALVGLVSVVIAAALADEVFGHGPRSSSPRVGSEA
jgi:predicted PurR-regulated permease PerM